jgi:hypothetical protein
MVGSVFKHDKYVLIVQDFCRWKIGWYFDWHNLHLGKSVLDLARTLQHNDYSYVFHISDRTRRIQGSIPQRAASYHTDSAWQRLIRHVLDSA